MCGRTVHPICFWRCVKLGLPRDGLLSLSGVLSMFPNPQVTPQLDPPRAPRVIAGPHGDTCEVLSTVIFLGMNKANPECVARVTLRIAKFWLVAICQA